MTDVQRDLGRFETRLDSLEADMRELKSDVKAIRTVTDEAKGGWRMLIAVGSAAGIVGSGITWLWQHIRVP